MEHEPVEETKIEVRSYFVRERNALLTRAHLGPLYMDYYLHLMQHSMRLDGFLDTTLKDALGALVLHLAARPWAEVTAWTVNFQDPRFNLFVTGDSRSENVVGRVFTEDVKALERNLFVSQVREPNKPVRKSVVECEGTDFFPIVEQFFQQSEQRPARLFRYAEEDFVMISAQPQCDLHWLAGLNEETIRVLDQQETLSLLEKRTYRFHCGCNVERIYPTLGSLTESGIAELFLDDPSIVVHCPRCGAAYEIDRKALEQFIA